MKGGFLIFFVPCGTWIFSGTTHLATTFPLICKILLDLGPPLDFSWDSCRVQKSRYISPCIPVSRDSCFMLKMIVKINCMLI